MDEFFDTQLVSQDAFDCYNSLHNTGRFKTLLDKRVTVQPGPCFMDNTPTPDTVACPGGETEFSFHLKNLRIPIMFSDGYDYIQSVRTNNIGMFFLTVGEWRIRHKNPTQSSLAKPSSILRLLKTVN